MPHDNGHPSTKRRGAVALLVLAALGVIYGDIGTSPLYAFQAAFGPDIGLTVDEPSGSVLMPKPLSAKAPPAGVAHTQAPDGSIFATNTSWLPALVRVVEPKVAVLWKYPVTVDEPSGSALMPWPMSPELPPARVTHT